VPWNRIQVIVPLTVGVTCLILFGVWGEYLIAFLLAQSKCPDGTLLTRRMGYIYRDLSSRNGEPFSKQITSYSSSLWQFKRGRNFPITRELDPKIPDLAASQLESSHALFRRGDAVCCVSGLVYDPTRGNVLSFPIVDTETTDNQEVYAVYQPDPLFQGLRL
jgi:hypothetical protein